MRCDEMAKAKKFEPGNFDDIDPGTEYVSAAPAPPGVYSVRLDGCPRRSIDTAMPAGPAAEAVARDRYLKALDLHPRHAKGVVVILEAEDAGANAEQRSRAAAGAR